MSFIVINTGDSQEDMNQYVSMLRRHREIKMDLKLRLDELATLHESHEAHIQRVSLASMPYDRDHIQSTGDVGDLLNVILQVAESETLQRKEHQQILKELELEDNSINRVWDAFRATSPENHILLNELYVQNIKWDALIDRYGSKSSLGNYRSAAVREALQLYNDPALSNEELHHMANHRSSLFEAPKGKSRRKKSAESTPGQISMEDFLIQT